MRENKYRKEKYSFRTTTLSASQTEAFKEKFTFINSTFNKYYLNKHLDVITFPILEKMPIHQLVTFLKKHKIPKSNYDVSISLVTEKSKDCIFVPKHVLEFLDALDCSFGFSVTYVGLNKAIKKSKYSINKHVQKNFYYSFQKSQITQQNKNLNKYSQGSVPNNHEIKIYLKKQINYKYVKNIITKFNITKMKCRLVISFKTPYDSHGLSIPEYVLNFYKRIGGDIEFKYECI